MGYRDVAPRQGMVWDLGSPAGWQHNLELEEALGGSVIQVSVPSGNPGHMGGLGRWPQVSSLRSPTLGISPSPGGLEASRGRGTEQGSQNVPRHHPANQGSPLTRTGDRGPAPGG